MKELTIGQMARLNGVSEQTLRLYDRTGLFSPMYRDEENGYRYYDIRQSAQLDMIQHMKSLGMSLKDIRSQLQDFDLEQFKKILMKNSRAIDEQIQELHYQKRAIRRTLESYEWYENAPPDGTIILEYIPRRLTYMVDSGINFYAYGIDVYEKILRDLKKNLLAHRLSPIYFYNAGTVLRKDKLLARNYDSTEIFVLVDEGAVEDKEKEYIDRLLETIEQRGYQITGDYICEVVAEVPMDMQERGMFLRLQIPVRL